VQIHEAEVPAGWSYEAADFINQVSRAPSPLTAFVADDPTKT
jgi:hypothetical protein